MITRRQLLDLGLTSAAIEHRIRKGRLHPVRRGVYAVGWPEVGILGQRMAAVLVCGPGAVLSHGSAGALWGVVRQDSRLMVTVPPKRHPRHAGITVHRSLLAASDRTARLQIPITAPVRTLIDLATCLPPRQVERAVNEADKLDLVGPHRLRTILKARPGERGVPALRTILDRAKFVRTDSELERRFVRLARAAGLPLPEGGVVVNGYKVDFFWKELGLVVETDGLRYHRTPSQQRRDLERDQAHAASGLETLRFTHWQVVNEPDHVTQTLRAVLRRLAPAG